MKKIILGFLVLVIVAFGVWKLQDNNAAQSNDKPTIRIGASLPLTGDAAFFGNLTKDAMGMALDKWKNKKTKYNYELVFSDDMLKPGQASLNANRLIDVNGVRAILSIWGTVDKVIDNISNKRQIITMSCTIGKGSMDYYAINNETPNEYYAEMLATQLHKNDIKKVALIIQNAQSNILLGDYIYDYLKESGIDVTDYEKPNADTRDYRMMIAKMQEKKPDYFIMQLNSPSMDIFTKQFMEANPKRNLTSIWNFAELSSDNLELVEGLWFIRGESGTDKFALEFKDKTNQEPNSCAANSYDNLDILIWAFENSSLDEGESVPNNTSVMKTLKSIKNWDGAIGNFSVDESGEVMNKPSLQIYQDGKFVKLKD